MRVYVISASDQGPSKIGISTDPEKRRRDLQTGHHERLEVRYTVRANDIENAQLIERTAHRSLLRLRSGAKNEWFNVPPTEAMIVTRAAAQAISALEDETLPFLELTQRAWLSWLKNIEYQRSVLDEAGESTELIEELRAPDLLEILACTRCAPTTKHTFRDYLGTYPESHSHFLVGNRHAPILSFQSYIKIRDTLPEQDDAERNRLARLWIEWSLARDLAPNESAQLGAAWRSMSEYRNKLELLDPCQPKTIGDRRIDDVAIYCEPFPHSTDRHCVIFNHSHFRVVLFPRRRMELSSLDKFARQILNPKLGPVEGFVTPVIGHSLRNEPISSWVRLASNKRDGILSSFLEAMRSYTIH